MAFTSVEFICFLAVTVLLYYLIPKRTQWPLLLLASYIFYFLAGGWYLPFIATTTVSSYFAAVIMLRSSEKEKNYIESNRDNMSKDERKTYKAVQKKKRFRILVAALILNFGILGVLKYTGFTLSNINSLIGFFGGQDKISVPSLILPLGISFYTFQTMGYLIDVYRNTTTAEKNIFRLALFVSFFPQLVQGPISRHSELASQLYEKHTASWSVIAPGALRVCWGYFKKLVIADTLMVAIKAIVESPAEHEGMYVVYLIIMYSAEIYADFTGGIDITIGVAQMLGIRVTENFNRPFCSKSTKEYWRRWHITMGSWFSDYVFYPVSICKPMQKLSKFSRAKLGAAVGKRIPVYLATILTWFLTGLWHGAGWNFIVWGLLNCLIILVSQELQPLYDRFNNKHKALADSRGWEVFCQVRTFLLMGIIRILDCYRDVPLTFKMFGTVFYSFSSWRDLFNGSLSDLGVSLSQYAVVIVAIIIVWAVSRKTEEGALFGEKLCSRPLLFSFCAAGLIAATLIFGSYGIGYDASQFIYSQF